MNIPIISIGNSKGIRIPQAILKQCQADKEFILEMQNGNITLKPVSQKNYDLTFENISLMSDSEIQSMLASVDSITLCIALIASNDTTKERVFKNLSINASEMIQNEINRLNDMDAKSLIIEMHRAKINTELSKLTSK